MSEGIGRSDVEAAWERVRPVVRRTPVLGPEPGAREGLGTLTLKLEFLQHTGTFKARGAANRVLAAQADGSLDPRVGIVVASGGNAGLANAWVAARLGVPATVFVPTTAPPVKVALLESYGATVVRAGSEYAAAFEAAQEHVARTGAVYCHAYDQPQIAAGAGTLALELLEQGGVDTIVVAVGGGGLLAGVAAAVEDLPVGVVGAEPVTSCALHAALAAGEPVDVAVSGVAADSLGASATSRSPSRGGRGRSACSSTTRRSSPPGRWRGRAGASSSNTAPPPPWPRSPPAPTGRHRTSGSPSCSAERTRIPPTCDSGPEAGTMDGPRPDVTRGPFSAEGMSS